MSWKERSVTKRLTPPQVEKLVALRQLDEPVTITNLGIRFGVSERTVYYYLSGYRRAAATLEAMATPECPES